MKLRHIFTLAAAMITIGCSSTLKPVTLDERTKHFPTQAVLPENAVKAKKPFRPEYVKLVYLKTDEKNATYNAFFIESFKNMKRFEKVVLKSDLEAYIFQNKLTDKVSSVSDMVGLHNLQKSIGDFLIVEPIVEFKGGYNFEASLKAIDPESGEVVLHLWNKAFNWAGLDEPLFYPLFNGFLDWTNEAPKADPAPAPKEAAPAQAASAK